VELGRLEIISVQAVAVGGVINENLLEFLLDIVQVHVLFLNGEVALLTQMSVRLVKVGGGAPLALNGSILLGSHSLIPLHLFRRRNLRCLRLGLLNNSIHLHVLHRVAEHGGVMLHNNIWLRGSLNHVQWSHSPLLDQHRLDHFLRLSWLLNLALRLHLLVSIALLGHNVLTLLTPNWHVIGVVKRFLGTALGRL
jgi:hypothetical protein